MGRWVYSDGGREAAGFRGTTGDCVVRAIAIATGLDYRVVYRDINKVGRHLERGPGRSSARSGVGRRVYDRYLKSIGWRWVATMRFGTGCRVHLRAEELPPGRLVVRVTKHLTAVVDGVIYDTFDPSREGFRCVYGFYTDQPETVAERAWLASLHLKGSVPNFSLP